MAAIGTLIASKQASKYSITLSIVPVKLKAVQNRRRILPDLPRVEYAFSRSGISKNI